AAPESSRRSSPSGSPSVHSAGSGASEDDVDEPEVPCRVCVDDEVAIEVTVDLLRGPPGAAGEHLFDLSTLSDDLVCGNDEVGNRAPCTFGMRLTQHCAGVCEHGPLTGFSGGQEHGRIGD